MTKYPIGYPGQYLLRYIRAQDGIETKKTVPYAAGDVPGTIIIPASSGRPLYGLHISYAIKVTNTPDVETMTGSGLYVNDRLFDRFKTSDGYDILNDLGLNVMSAVQDSFFREDSVDVLADVLQTAHDVLTDELRIPCYSEIPVMVDLKLHDISLEYTGGTFEVDADERSIVFGAMYGDELLGMEQPILERHTEVVPAGRGQLESLKTIKPFKGVILTNSSYARAESLSIVADLQHTAMVDDKNEVEDAADMRSAIHYYRPIPDSLEVFTDKAGHLNQGHSEVAITPGNESTFTYVGIFTPLKGATGRKTGKIVVTS